MPTRTAALRRLPRMPRLLQWLAQTLALRRQRAHLVVLDDRLLRDIGLTRDDARREASRPFWGAPTLWQRPVGPHRRE